MRAGLNGFKVRSCKGPWHNIVGHIQQFSGLSMQVSYGLPWPLRSTPPPSKRKPPPPHPVQVDAVMSAGPGGTLNFHIPTAKHEDWSSLFFQDK